MLIRTGSLAGWFGLAAAKTYIELHADEKILIVESASTVGGTWSQDRLYPGLKSNNMYGSYEFPDFPMAEEIYGVKPGEHIPAAVLHQYLTDFSKTFGIFERTAFNTKVESAEPTNNGGWVLTTSSDSGARVLRSAKVVVATGLTSQPNVPSYPGQQSFTAPFFHAKDFCRNSGIVKTAKRAVVVGGGKSAYDCAYAFATEAGAETHLIIRPTGQGPVWICPPYVTPFKRMMEELLHTRCLTWFSPCPWGAEDGFGQARDFLHGTAAGRWIVDNYWNKLTADVIEANGYNENARLFKMRPWNPVIWTASGTGIHNYPSSLFDLVSEGRIVVHLADIENLDSKTVQLTNGESIETDVLLCATGWKKESSIKYANFEMGLPGSEADMVSLSNESDSQIVKMFPSLKFQPVLRFERKREDPFRLYRFMVPPTAVSKRNIVFAGLVSTVSTAMFATVQALWISAFFDGKLERMAKTEKEVEKEVMLHTQFGKWRYPCGYGDSLPDFAFDSLPYVDLLLNDLGVKVHRKPTQIAELFEPYKPKDYRGLTREWLGLQKDQLN